MKKIAFDVMGSDAGVKDAILATMTFINKFSDYSIVLVGDEKEIKKYLIPHDRISILNNSNQVDKSSNLRYVHKEDNSMNDALRLLKDGEVDGCLSPGDSARLMISAVFILKKIEGINRPAFMPIFPTVLRDKKMIMLDVGANLDINSDHLIQWAKLGNAFSKSVLNVSNPKVSILNVGIEENKGFKEHQTANELLRELKQKNEINYVGFVEARELLSGEIDVVVTDGYAGNIALKSMEGAIINFQKIIKQNLTSNIFRKINALFLKKAFTNIKEHLDYRNVGAAWIIGVEGMVIKCHGSSDEKGYNGSLMQIKKGIDSNALIEFKKVL
ncbi:MAG: phosphate acyltransferase PlsX [Mycoplasmataceae bacterium]|nr:phosphate acyltransferase PlsX [Mycoplasmataceae bacterium]